MKKSGLLISLLVFFFILNVSQSMATIRGDSELLKLTAEVYTKNLVQVRFWSGCSAVISIVLLITLISSLAMIRHYVRLLRSLK